MPGRIIKTVCFTVLIIVACLAGGNRELGLYISFNHHVAYSSLSPNSQQHYKTSINKPGIGQVKVKTRFMAGECNYFAPTVRFFTLCPKYPEQVKALRNVSLLSIYFSDSFHLRGPPSIA